MRHTRLTRPAVRNTYARTGLDFLVNNPDGFPSDFPPGNWTTPPPLWWNGIDTGGGAYPIGPNGPFPAGTAGAVPAVVRATSLITGPITSAPFRVTNGATNTEAPRWLTDPMLLRPDARFPVTVEPEVSQLPRSLFWTEWVRSAIWWGVGAFVCLEDATTGAPLAGSLKMLHPRYLSTERVGTELRWVLGNNEGEDPLVFDRNGYWDVPGTSIRYRLVALRNPHSPVDTEGRSQGVFAMSPSTFALSGQIDGYAQGTFRSGIPAGYLKVQTPGLTADAADMLKARWLAAHGGDRRSIAVLNATTEFQPLNLSPVDAALAEVKRLNMADVAMAFGLDPLTLGVGLGNSATYNNLRDAWTNHRDFGLAPWTAAVEDTLSALLPGTGMVRVNLDGFANPTAAERFTAYETALGAGILTVDEVRRLENLPPMPAGQSVDPSALSQQEAVQKVYLGVGAGVITVAEARQMINDAGGHLDVDAPVPPPPGTAPAATEPAAPPEGEPNG